MQRIKKDLSEAICELLKGVKSINDIEVNDISKKAGCHRSSVRRYFPTPGEFVKYYLGKMFDEYLQIRDISLYSPQRAQSFFSICLKHKAVLLALHRDGLLSIAIDVLNEKFIILSDNKDITADQMFKLFWHTGGLCNTLIRWVSEGMTESPEQLAAFYSANVGENTKYMWE